MLFSLLLLDLIDLNYNSTLSDEGGCSFFSLLLIGVDTSSTFFLESVLEFLIESMLIAGLLNTFFIGGLLLDESVHLEALVGVIYDPLFDYPAEHAVFIFIVIRSFIIYSS